MALSARVGHGTGACGQAGRILFHPLRSARAVIWTVFAKRPCWLPPRTESALHAKFDCSRILIWRYWPQAASVRTSTAVPARANLFSRRAHPLAQSARP